MVKVTVVDAKGHLLGRLAASIAKELLNGRQVVVVRCEEINVSGSLYRNKLKFEAFLRKRMNTKPQRGPIHYRAPSRILWRAIRGMLPHKTARGAAALGRIKVFEGVPHPFDKTKRMVVPDALRNLRLKPGRKFCRLGDLSSQVGWRHNELIKRLEAHRVKKATERYYPKKKAAINLKKQAKKAAASELEPVAKQLKELGYSV